MRPALRQKAVASGIRIAAIAHATRQAMDATQAAGSVARSSVRSTVFALAV